MKTKKAMMEYISDFEKYPTMNSWNGSYGYSRNVKIHNLPLTSAQRTKIYEAMESEDFFTEIGFTLNDLNTVHFEKHGTYTEKKEIRSNIEGMTAQEVQKRREALEKSGYTYDRHGTSIMTMWKNVQTPIFSAGFNGRSGGHLVLYKWNGHNMAGTGWSHDKAELEEMSRDEVRDIYDILVSFQAVHDGLLDQVRYIADNSTIEDETYTTTHSRKVLTIA